MELKQGNDITLRPENQTGIKLTRRFTTQGQDPFDQIEWETRDVEIVTPTTREVVYHASGLEFPKSWSQNATGVVSEKYFRVIKVTNGVTRHVRETSVRQMINRVVDTITSWGVTLGYFHHASGYVDTFRSELKHILVNQMAAFNSPVWFNVGTRGGMGTEQCSACFINSIEDNMESILQLSVTEGVLYKGGSGSGVNYSPLRSSREQLSGGGFASGPVPFIAKDDQNAGAIKSGGTTRRAAKMAILDIDHGDVLEFIRSKVNAERASHALIDAGFESDFRARWGAYAMVPFQNANHSIRVTDDFMRAVVNDKPWDLIARDGHTVIETLPAQQLWNEACVAAHECGDPGLQFDTTINKMHTTPKDGRIDASNPCCFVGDTLVETSEGRIRIDELQRMSEAGDEMPYAFAWDTYENLPVLRRIKKAWKAGSTKELMHVATDKGASLWCTPEHRFLLRNGKWVEAQNLQSGTRLRKIGRWSNAQRAGRYSLNHRATSACPSGTSIQARWMWEQAHGPIPPAMHVHHLNENPTDDRLSNLELRDSSEHQREHAQGASNPRFMEIRPEVLVEVYEDIELIPRQTHKNQPPVTPARWNAYIRRAGLVGQIPMAQSPSLGGRIQGMTWPQFEDFIEDHRDDVNDYVVLSVRSVSEVEQDVYDLEVDGVHNFSVADADCDHGIIVHNSEYMFLADTACNLASINLMKYRRSGGQMNYIDFEHTVDTMITAMEILVDGASYPTEKIAKNSEKYRTLGLGYTNLGAYLMSDGIAYDSDQGRKEAANIASLMTARAYGRSAEIAAHMGPFAAYDEVAMQGVMHQHRDAATTHRDEWDRTIALGEKHGYRNAQATVLAPTGTISFLMDCDTTGVEPVLSLKQIKKLVGGGTIEICNQRVGDALRSLGYNDVEVGVIEAYVLVNGTVVDSGLQDQHYGVFDSSFPEPREGRFLRPEAHVLMMGAIQPFISGAISKTCNVPNSATVEDVANLYELAWTQGLKSIALYRDGSKGSQPVTTQQVVETPQPVRRPMPTDADAKRHKFKIGSHSGYIHPGMYEDGSLGEVFIKMAKVGSTVQGLMDTIGVLTSLALQHGVPLELLVDKFSHASFEPSGWSKNPDVGFARSPIDYLFRYLGSKFLEKPELEATPETAVPKPDGQTCGRCGNLTQRAGSCATCRSCGWTEGCG